MKLKVLIALSLALVMIVTLASPILAGRPERGNFLSVNEELGTGKYAFQATHDNNLKYTVVLRGALPDTQYYVMIEWSSGSSVEATFTTNKMGTVRFRGIFEGPFAAGDKWFKIDVWLTDPDIKRFAGSQEWITFK